MITGSIYLRKLVHAFIDTPKGDKAIVIPIKKNKLKVSKTDTQLFLNFVAWDRKTPSEFGDTHIIKQSFTKEEREAMSDEETNNLPIIGNLKIIDDNIEGKPLGEDEVVGTDDLPF